MKIWLIPLIGLAFVLIGACGSNGTPSPPIPRLGTIQGTVTDASGGPGFGFRVLIVSGTAPYPEIASLTDEEGFYRLGSISPGTYEVAVHDQNGDRVGLDSFAVKAGETSTLDLQITQRPNLISWTEAINLIMSGEVQQVVQTHSLEVTLILKNGTTLDTKEPAIDEVFREIERCGDLCSGIVKITE